MGSSSHSAAVICCLAASALACARPPDPGPLVDPADFEQDADGFLSARPASGWVPLLGGDELEGWELVGGEPAGAVLRGGVLAFSAAGGGGYLRTLEDFRDFRLRLDFKIARLANSGVFLRGARDGSDPAYSGCEIQILDDFNWEAEMGGQLKPFQLTGGLYGSLAPGAAALRPLGEWNTYAIEYRGPRLRVELNGRLLYDVDTRQVPGKPFAERAAQGFIGLQRHAPERVGPGPYAWFRNVFVRRLQ